MILMAIRQTLMLLFFMMLGVVCTKAGILNKERSKGLSDLLLYVITPALIISKLQTEYSAEHTGGLIYILLVSLAGFLLYILLAQISIRGKDKEELKISRFATIYPNTGYVGIPLLQGILGAEGGFYSIGPITTFNLLAFTHGEIMMSKTEGKIDWKKILLSPTLIAIAVGMILFFCRIRLPEIVKEPVDMLAATMSPLAMMVAGNSLTGTNLKEIKKKKRVLQVMLNRLLLFPGFFAFLVSLIPGNDLVRMAVIISMACPTAAITVMYSVKYDHDDAYASILFSLTTIFSIVSIPLVVAFAGILGIRP